MVFIDSRLSPDDQISFLQSKITEATPDPDVAGSGVAQAA
jgi:hypothetical protein